MKGTVKWFNPARGIGFILGEDGNDYFVHYSNIVDSNSKYRMLKKGNDVNFEVGTDDTGRISAKNVTRITEPAPAI